MGDNSASCGARYHLATTPDAAGVEPARRHGQEVHGLYRLRRGVEELGKRGLRPVRGNTQLGRALARWRGQLIRDLGGDPSTAQLAIVDLAARTRLRPGSSEPWLIARPSLVSKPTRSLLPVVTQRQILADALARYLAMLGLERRQARVPSLEDYLAGAEPAEDPAEKQPKGAT